MVQLTMLQVEPDSSLHFCKTPSTPSPSRTLKLTNTHSGHVAFKVKTTAPKAYLVRPSSGTLRPRASQEVQIILQPAGITDGHVNNHRFLVQAVEVATSEPLSREDFQKFRPEQIQEARLNVYLEEKKDETGSKPAENGFGLAAPTGAAAGGAASGTSAAEAPADPKLNQYPELKQKYDELVQYTLLLENEKKKLEEAAKVKQSSSAASKAAAKVGSGYGTLHMVIVAALGVALAYATRQFAP
jgi:DNA-directed RNA polymerase I, II, and III subunit RPABC2